MRKEAIEPEFQKELRINFPEGMTRMVVKMLQSLLLPLIDNEKEVTKQKTRSEIVAEEATEEVVGAKKKNKKPERGQRIIHVGYN